VGLVHSHHIPASGLSPSARQSILQIAAAACQRLAIASGPAYFQFKYWQNQPFLIEITPRLDGCHLWRLIRYATGVDLLRITFEHLLGRSPCPADFTCKPDGAFELEFTCQLPGQPARNPPPPPHALFFDFYNSPGESVHSINGLLEKTGYFITRSNPAEAA